MSNQLRTRDVDLLIVRLARGQHWVVSAAQLFAAGVTRAMVFQRVHSGRLHVVHRGVYSLSPVLSERARQMAALLACGPNSVLSHRSAGSIWRLRSYPEGAFPWVTVPPSRPATRPRIEIVRCRLEPQDIRKREGLRLTSPPRTVIDLASGLEDDYEVEALVAEASFRGLASEAEFVDQLTRYPRRQGNRAVRWALDLPGGPQRTRSGGERFLLRHLRARGINGFEANASVCGREVDFYWRDQRFAVEVDGWDGHKGRVAFERDRAKWAFLKTQSVDVMPVGAQRLRRNPDAVIDDIAAVLRRG